MEDYELITSELIEITTRIGCSVNCKKYCPQELLVKSYKGSNEMSLSSFKTILSTVPAEVIVVFSGFCEPFLNRECIDMIEHASKKGHKIILNTTLVGATVSDIERLKHTNLVRVILHLPDGENANIPITDEYKNVLCLMLTTIPVIQFVSMNSLFSSNNRENFVKGRAPLKWYPITCAKFNNIQPVVLPNGDVYLCCMDFGLRHRIGNLLTGSYQKLKNSPVLVEIQESNLFISDTLCKRCSYALPIGINELYIIYRKLRRI